MNSVNLAYALADQNFTTTKSVGIFNLSVGLLGGLSAHSEIGSLDVLGNRTLTDRLPAATKINLTQHDLPLNGMIGRILWDQWGAYNAAKKTRADWLLLPKGYASFLCRSRTRLATYVHDVMPEYYHEQRLGGFSLMEKTYFRMGLRAAIRNSSLILTNSEFTKLELKRVADRLGIKTPPTEVVGIGFDEWNATERSTRDRLVILINRLPHKCSARIIDYFCRWHEKSKNTRPVHWVGRPPIGVTLPEYPGWQHHERLPDGEYRELLSNASTLVYGSAYEGFGMPPVEAILAGACPVYSSLPVTREVMTDAGCPFDNDDYSSFSNALESSLKISPSMIEDWADSLRQRFNWAKVAERTVAALQRENDAH